jgi:hypothetical protein
MGRTPNLTSRDYCRLLIIVKKYPTIGYSALRTAAGLAGDDTTGLISNYRPRTCKYKLV